MTSLLSSLALFVQSDPGTTTITTTQSTQDAANALAGVGMGLIVFGMLFGLVITAFFVFLFWRIFVRAGMSGALSLLTLVPGVGIIIVLCILAFGDWKVAPATSLNPYGGPPTPYPPNAYPTQAYPPQSYGPGTSNYPPSGQV